MSDKNLEPEQGMRNLFFYRNGTEQDMNRFSFIETEQDMNRFSFIETEQNRA